jgi:hypothetical protein
LHQLPRTQLPRVRRCGRRHLRGHWRLHRLTHVSI